MEDLERRVTVLEEKIRSDVASFDHIANSHTERLARIEDMIWRDGNSITAQILKLRTELRTISVGVVVLVPVVMKVIDIWLERI